MATASKSSSSSSKSSSSSSKTSSSSSSSKTSSSSSKAGSSFSSVISSKSSLPSLSTSKTSSTSSKTTSTPSTSSKTTSTSSSSKTSTPTISNGVASMANGGVKLSNGTVVGGMSIAPSTSSSKTSSTTSSASKTSSSASKTSTPTTFTSSIGSNPISSLSSTIKASTSTPSTSTKTSTTSSSTKSSSSTPTISNGVASMANGQVKLANGTYVGGMSVAPTTATKSSGGSSGGSSSSTKISGTTPVASMANGQVKLANGTLVGGTTSSTKSTSTSSPSTSTSVATKAVASNANGTIKLDNGKTVTAVQSLANGMTKLSDGSMMDKQGNIVGTAAPAKSSSNNVTSANKSAMTTVLQNLAGKNNVNSTTTNVNTKTPTLQSKSLDTKSIDTKATAVASMQDGTIRYSDGSIRDAQGNVISGRTDDKKYKDTEIRNVANEKSNNSSATNGTQQNNVNKENTTVTSVVDTNKNKDAGVSMMNNNSNMGNNTSSDLSTDSRYTADGSNSNYTPADQTKQQVAVNKIDKNSVSITTENGKEYIVSKLDDGSIGFLSQGGDTKGQWVNLRNEDGSINNNTTDIFKYITENNKADGINRGNTENSNAISQMGGDLAGTYTAPSGKEYDIVEGRDGQVGFVSIDGTIKYYQSWADAKNVIDRNNPVGSKDLNKNTPQAQMTDRGYLDENGNVKTGIDDLDETNEWNQEQLDEQIQGLEEWKDEMRREFEDWRDEAEDIYGNKTQLITEMFNDIDSYTANINDAIADLQEKQDLINDNEKMRWARQRAAEMAAKGYLTSEQVAQVANYSLTDYNKELEASMLESQKAIAELRITLEQKRQDYINIIRNQQFANENDRQTQINWINDKIDNMLTKAQDMATSANQFYNSQINANLQGAIQNELGYDSLLRQNEANIVIDERNAQKAYTDPAYRRQYILKQVQDANLLPYVERAINQLISQGTFVNTSYSNAQQKQFLTNQIGAIMKAAQTQQQIDLKNLK